MAELKIKVGADVADAVKNLTAVEQRTAVLQKRITDLQSVVANTTSIDKFNRASDLLVKNQSELAKITAISNSALKGVTPTSSAATQSLVNLSRVAQDAPFGFIGIANNINPLLESFQRLKVSTGTTGGAFKELGKSLIGPAGLGLAVGVASSLLITFGDRLFGASKAAKEASEKAKQLRDSIQGIFEGSGKEAANVNLLITVLKTETETRERKLAAIKELQRIQPEVFSSLKLEGDTVNGLDAAYQQYLANLQSVIKVKIRQLQLEQLITKQLQLQDKNLGLQSTIALPSLINPEFRDKALKDLLRQVELNKQEFQNIQAEINNILKDIATNSQGIDLKSATIKTTKDKNNEDKYWYYTIGITKDQLKAEAPRISAEINKVLESAIRPKSFLGEESFKVNEKALNALREKLQVLGDVALTVGNIFSSAFDGLFQALVQGGNAIQAFGQAFIQALTGVISKLIQTAILAAIVSALGGGVGIGASSNKFGDIFKLLSGFGGFRAGGGPVEAGKTYAVGERGMELFTPSVSGRIIPNNQIGSVSAGGRLSNGGGSVVLRGRELRLLGIRTTNSQLRLGVRA